MTNDDASGPIGSPAPRRSPRQGIGGSPVGSTLSIVLAVVAVIVGFLILNNITDDGGSDAGGAPESTVPSTVDDTIADTTTTTTEPPLVLEGATVIVANASGVPQSAGAMTTELASVGFTMGTATNATQSGLATSLVYYDPAIAAAQDVANSVARVMGGLAVESVPDPIPVEGGSLNGAGVLVMLGTDAAGKSLAEIAPTESPTVSAPAVSGDDATTGTTQP
jgi:hypothetical protein